MLVPNPVFGVDLSPNPNYEGLSPTEVCGADPSISSQHGVCLSRNLQTRGLSPTGTRKHEEIPKKVYPIAVVWRRSVAKLNYGVCPQLGFSRISK